MNTLIQIDRRSAEARALIERAELATRRADRAFRRWFTREVQSGSAATRLQRAADEAWADVRLRIRGGEMIEARWDERDVALGLGERSHR